MKKVLSIILMAALLVVTLAGCGGTGTDEKTIAVIAKGRIAEEGTHQELMKIDDGIYKGLYTLGIRNSESDFDGEISEISVDDLSKKAGF